jgi:hypothetical protein
MTATPNYELRRTMPARWAHVGAMQIEIDRRDLHAVGEYLCIGDLAPRQGRPVLCNINGDWIGRADWWQPVRVGDVVVFCEVAGGGGGSNPLRILAMVAVAAFTWGYGGALLGINGAAAVGNAGVLASNVAVSVGAALLVDSLYPRIPGTAQAASSSPTYSASLQGNQPRLGQPVPVRYGQEMVSPDMAAPAYTEFAGADFDQFYCTALALGLGEYEILSILIDDTPIQFFADADVAIVGPGMTGRTQQTGYPAFETFTDQDVVETNIVTATEVSGQDLLDNNWCGPFTALKAGFQADRLFVDVVFPRGLGSVQNSGGIDNRTLAWQVAAQRIDDGGAALGPWEVLALESYTNHTSQVIRRSYQYDVTPGRYRVRMRRVSGRSDNDRHLNDFQWAQLRSRLTVDGISRTDLTGVAIRIRASRQLSALTQRRVRIMARRLIPTFNGTTWTAVQFTRNPAWALADVWRNTTYGRGLADSRIDIDSLEAYAALWTDRQDRFDYSFDTQQTIDDAAQFVAAAGRARPILRRGAVFSLVRDELQTDAVATFMPRNTDADSFGLVWALPTSDTPDCIECKYRDGRYWDERLVYAQVHDGQIYGYVANGAGVPQRPPGLPAPGVIESVPLKGVIGQMQALRQAAYLMARSVWRRKEGSFAADMDGMLMSMGSLIAIGHDVAAWAQSGDVVDWDAGTLTLTVSEPPQWTAGEPHYVRLQSRTGEPGGAILATPGATDFELVLDEMPTFAPIFDDASKERTRYLFGSLDQVMRKVIAAGIRPTSDDAVEIQWFAEDDRVHAADAPWLPTGDEVQDPLSDGVVSEGDDTETAFVEDFEDGVAPYTLIAGAPFTSLVATTYGQSLQVASIDSSTIHRYRRDLPSTIAITELTVKFRITEYHEDDAALMRLFLDGVERITFIPKRDNDFDSAERPRLGLRGLDPVYGVLATESMVIGSEQIEVDVWYLLRLLIIPGAGNTSASITRIEDNELMGTVGFANDYAGMAADQLEWSADSGGQTCETQYDDLTIAS